MLGKNQQEEEEEDGVKLNIEGVEEVRAVQKNHKNQLSEIK